MTPLDSGSTSLSRATVSSSPVRVGLGTPPQPAHLPFLAGAALGVFGGRGPAIAVDAVEGTAAAFARLADDTLDVALVPPLALVQPVAAVEPIGCLLRSAGGILIRGDRLAALCEGDTVRIASIGDHPPADGYCRRILQGWAAQEGLAIAAQTIHLDAARGLDPLAALAAGYDGAWPALACDAAIAADTQQPPLRLVTAEECGLPAIGALELVARRCRTDDETARLEALVAALAEAVRRLQADVAAALALWQRHGGGDDPAAAAVLRAALPCLQAPLDRRPGRWRALATVI